MTVPGAVGAIEQLRARLGTDAVVGAGTVTTPQMVTDCLNVGAQFIVSPATVPALIPPAQAREVPTMIGALTPTEVLTAWQAGCDLVKVFPCSALGGASYLKALRGPFPDLPLVPTGGVTLDTMGDYLEAGARALGVGTALANHSLLSKEGASAVTDLARRYVERFSQLRAGD
jgi:2-dehydro-3-deoxyphosphogluconate aldolase/(4S)-4-hydroxy-2-oxoglutarate aldolase